MWAGPLYSKQYFEGLLYPRPKLSALLEEPSRLEPFAPNDQVTFSLPLAAIALRRGSFQQTPPGTGR